MAPNNFASRLALCKTVQKIKELSTWPETISLQITTTGVDLGKLSWRAVVPLYNLGFRLRQIDKMVDFGLGITERVFDHHMEKAADIIEYYEKVKAHRECHKVQPASPDSYHIKAQSGDIEHIADLLEKGKFTPPEIGGFLDFYLWKHPVFQR